MSQSISIFGETLFDCFPGGECVLGGAPFNVAWHLQAFQQSPLLISRLGQDLEGDSALAAMQNWGLSTQGIQIDSQYPTGRVAIELSAGEPSYTICSHQAYDYIDISAKRLNSSDWLYHGSLALREDAQRQKFLDWRCQQTAQVFIDLNLREPWWTRSGVDAMLIGADWLKLNHEELSALVGKESTTQENLLQLIRRYGLKGIILTAGAAGASLLLADGQFFEVKPSGSQSIVDTVGAGDAFAAICLLGLKQQWPFQLILDQAQQFASALLNHRGAIVTDISFYQHARQFLSDSRR